MSFKEAERGKENTIYYTCFIFKLSYLLFLVLCISTCGFNLPFVSLIHSSLVLFLLPSSVKYVTFPYVIYLTIQFTDIVLCNFLSQLVRERRYMYLVFYIYLNFSFLYSTVLFEIVKTGNNSNICKQMNILYLVFIFTHSLLFSMCIELFYGDNFLRTSFSIFQLFFLFFI